MILACLNCSARFMVSADAIGARGRVVRCGRCDHVWFAPPSPDLVRAAAGAAGSEPPPASTEDGFSVPPLRDPDELRIDPPPTRVQLPVLRQERRRWPARLAWAAVVAIAICLAAAAAWRYSAEVVAHWPDAEPIYAAFGIDALPPGFGLQLTIERSDHTLEDDVRLLSITGRIQNTTSRLRRVPLLRGALFDGDERELWHWTIPAPAINLAPDQEVGFTTEVADPPQEAVRISIVFHQPG